MLELFLDFQSLDNYVIQWLLNEVKNKIRQYELPKKRTLRNQQKSFFFSLIFQIGKSRCWDFNILNIENANGVLMKYHNVFFYGILNRNEKGAHTTAYWN